MAAKKPVQLRKKLLGGQQSAQTGNRNPVRPVPRCEPELCNLSEEQIQSSAIYRLLQEEMRVMASRQAIELAKLREVRLANSDKVVARAAAGPPQEGAVQYEGADLGAQERGHGAQVVHPRGEGRDRPPHGGTRHRRQPHPPRRTRRLTIHYLLSSTIHTHSHPTTSDIIIHHHSLLRYSKFQKESPT